MENKQPIKSSKLNNLFKITGILGIIVVSLSLLFYLVIFPYQKEQKKIEYEKRYNQAKMDCNAEAKKLTNEEPIDEDPTDNQTRSFYDIKYMLCLRGKGIDNQQILNDNTVTKADESRTIIEPEEYEDRDNSETPMPTLQAPIPQSTESMMDEFDREREQECQNNLNEYNACLSEYNSKMAEYNSCLTESSNPNSWRHGSYCSKPFNFCYKPICAY